MFSKEKWILDTIECLINDIENAPSCEEAEEYIDELKDFICIQRKLLIEEE